MSIPRPHINEESELDHRIAVRELGPIGFAQAWSYGEVVDKGLPERCQVPHWVKASPIGYTVLIKLWEFQLWELYGLDERYWAYRLVHK